MVNNNQHFLCKLQDNDTLRSYEMTAIFQEKTIVNFPMCYFLAKLENTLRYLEVMYISYVYMHLLHIYNTMLLGILDAIF